jgi:hypothetical protein
MMGKALPAGLMQPFCLCCAACCLMYVIRNQTYEYMKFNNHFFIVCFLRGNSPASEFYMPSFRNTLPMKMEQTECSETSAYKIQTPGNFPKESIQHLEYGENLKSRIIVLFAFIQKYDWVCSFCYWQYHVMFITQYKSTYRVAWLRRL